MREMSRQIRVARQPQIVGRLGHARQEARSGERGSSSNLKFGMYGWMTDVPVPVRLLYHPRCLYTESIIPTADSSRAERFRRFRQGELRLSPHARQVACGGYEGARRQVLGCQDKCEVKKEFNFNA